MTIPFSPQTIALAVIVAVYILLILSLFVLGKARVKEISSKHSYHYELNFIAHKKYGFVEIPTLCFVPLAIVSLIEILWVYIGWPIPYKGLDILTPSFHDSNWVWAGFISFIVPIPCGIQLYLLIKLFTSIEPESKVIHYLLIALTTIGLLALTYVIAKVYSVWFIWWPILCGDMYSFALWPLTPSEKKKREEERKEREEEASARMATARRSQSSSRPSPNPVRNTGSRSTTSGATTRQSRLADDRSERMAIEQRMDDYLYRARQYENDADRLESEAASYDRSADDNEYWARETGDSSRWSAAQNDRNRANSLRYQARQAKSQADHFYSLYRSEQSRLKG